MEPIPPLPTADQLWQALVPLRGLPTLVAVGLSVFLLVAPRDWRIVVAAFMGLSFSLALLMSTLLPAEWALLRVIVGGLVAVIWYLSAQRAGWGGRFLPFRSETGVNARPLSSLTWFRALMALTAAGLLLVLRVRLPLPPVPPDIQIAATWLAVFALVGLGLGDEALQVGAALLMWLGATQLVLSALELDPWLFWLVSSAELLVGLATGYLMVARGSPATRRVYEEGS
ncbi:MAG: hypothetical protein NZ528_00865 [Caldilineales bacterium]|nr:hypothetical protein [Caldilineales bacterium]MDW8316450.1 hypothetical protein [Anaerolineae bacterium]